MSLNLAQILPQINQLTASIVERRRLREATLPEVQQSLRHTAEMAREALLARVVKAGDRWPGAAPSDEPVDGVFPAPSAPAQFTIVGADGSQIYPDRHATAFYYVINIGSIRLVHGSLEVPQTTQDSSVYYAEEDLYDTRGRPIQPAMVNLRRDVAEMQALAALARDGSDPSIALLDNSLLLWMTLEADAGARREIDSYLHQYLTSMDELRQGNVALAGFVDRPRNANTLALIHLAGLDLEAINPEQLQTAPFHGLTDYDLFRTLIPEGCRSARFIYTSPLNRDFEAAGHQVQYFYLNPGSGEGVVRVEIPAWVGNQPDLLNSLHAGLLQDCSTTGGFPYVLVRAHELALVNPRERDALEQQIDGHLMRSGDHRGPSQKSITKRWTQNRRRHRL